MKSVAILNWGGHGNFGDEIMLEGLRQLFQGWQIQVVSDNDKSTYPKIDFDAVNKCDLFVLGGGELINADRLFFALPSYFHSLPFP